MSTIPDLGAQWDAFVAGLERAHNDTAKRLSSPPGTALSGGGALPLGGVTEIYGLTAVLKTLAQDWAEKAAGLEVAPGQYSARHWANASSTAAAQAQTARDLGYASAGTLTSLGATEALPASTPFNRLDGTTVTSASIAVGKTLFVGATRQFYKVATFNAGTGALTWTLIGGGAVVQASGMSAVAGPLDFTPGAGQDVRFNGRTLMKGLVSGGTSVIVDGVDLSGIDATTAPVFQRGFSAHPAYPAAGQYAPQGAPQAGVGRPNLVVYEGFNFNANGTRSDVTMPALGRAQEFRWGGPNGRLWMEDHVSVAIDTSNVTHRLISIVSEWDGARDMVSLRAGQFNVYATDGSSAVQVESDVVAPYVDLLKAYQMRHNVNNVLFLRQRKAGAPANGYATLAYLDDLDQLRLGVGSSATVFESDLRVGSKKILATGPNQGLQIGSALATDWGLDLLLAARSQEAVRLRRVGLTDSGGGVMVPTHDEFIFDLAAGSFGIRNATRGRTLMRLDDSAAGVNRPFVRRSTGRFGLGTDDPQADTHIVGNLLLQYTAAPGAPGAGKGIIYNNALGGLSFIGGAGTVTVLAAP